jgi:hypothetical protein
MRVTAMLAWWNEDPALLRRAVMSAANICDHVLALDGRWDYYPGESIRSPLPQYEAIEQAASDARLNLSLYPGKLYTGQVEKRNQMLRLAKDSDWLMPLDADWEIKGERYPSRHILGNTRADALIVALHTKPNTEAKLQDVAATSWHERLAGDTVYEPLVWRNLKGIRIENYHWLYSGLDSTGQRVALWGQQDYPQARTEKLQTIRIEHHCLHRDERTILANRIYCQERDRYAGVHGREP